MNVDLRIGHGYDVHAFEPGEFITLGGVRIAHHQGLLAHSDGDVLLHALCDAMLGALSMGDIGQHFPDTQAQYANADSRKLLKHVYALLNDKGYVLHNADMTVLAQQPKLAPHVKQMRAHIADDLDTDIERISVKATTTEKLGFVGQEQGIAAHAVVLLAQHKS